MSAFQESPIDGLEELYFGTVLALGTGGVVSLANANKFTNIEGGLSKFFAAAAVTGSGALVFSAGCAAALYLAIKGDFFSEIDFKDPHLMKKGLFNLSAACCFLGSAFGGVKIVSELPEYINGKLEKTPMSTHTNDITEPAVTYAFEAKPGVLQIK